MHLSALTPNSAVYPTMNLSSADRRLIPWPATGVCGYACAMGTSLAGLAQLVEQLPCKHQVAGSTPAAGTISAPLSHQSGVAP